MLSHVERSTRRQLWQERLIRNPWLESRKVDSNGGSKRRRSAVWTTLSMVLAMASGRPPSGVGRMIRSAGFGAYLCK